MRLGSRGSALARWQAAEVQRRLRQHGTDVEIEIVVTSGDRRTDVALATIGGKGLFTQEIEAGLLDGRLDLAVHSLKDVPTQLPPGLELVAMIERADPRDVLIAAPGMTLERLPRGARVATSSLRRQAQALALRPGLQVVPIRGNVDTRLRRWRDGDFDALLLAAAGLTRLEHTGEIAEYLDPERFCPAAGQGVLALEARSLDAATRAATQPLNDPATALAATAERALLARLNCGCQAPVAAYARLTAPDRLEMRALVALPDGSRSVRRSAHAVPAEAAALGRSLAEALLADGADAILQAIYG
ncbi:MAG TPA: hydroxymethylbilane synthase [Terriglobales bacterium]|nr:hydroxymethylbilane synthase [Terriglobales bacterium]